MIAVIFVSFGLCLACGFAIAYFINKLLRKTVWYENIFAFTHQFKRKVSNETYEVVNVGSNPARFAFFYEDVLGENWSTGTQGLDMDLEVLKHYSYQLKPGAHVFLPIVPFSSVSGYLTNSMKQYSAKFASVLDVATVTKYKRIERGYKYLKYPILSGWRTFKFLFRDAEPDKRLQATEQCLQLPELEADANWWLNMWKEEFSIPSWETSLPEHLHEGREKSINMLCHLIDYIINQGFKPVLISTPMSAPLSALFTQQIKDTYIYSFIEEAQIRYDIPYLNYIDTKEFQDNSLYFNALFMNLRGRKLFTRRVLKDLKLI